MRELNINQKNSYSHVYTYLFTSDIFLYVFISKMHLFLLEMLRKTLKNE